MRILSGEFKGRKLLGPVSRCTRPITASVKKSLFGMLTGRLEGAVVLDLYCGTGTLGLEAMSRGAGRCFFADRHRAALRRLRRNIETLQAADRCVIWDGDVMRKLSGWVASMDEQVDIGFVDPPYAQSRSWDWASAAGAIFSPLGEVLAPDGVVVVRVPSKLKVPDVLGPLKLYRTRSYSGMVLLLLARD